MTGSMSRRLYRQFLSLYPEPFRREFGDEMVSVFEECRGTQGAWRLLVDALLSAAKQQFHYFATPIPKSALLFSTTGSSPKLARVLAVAVFGAELTAGVLVGKPATPQAPALIRSEALFWFPTAGWGRYCSATPNRTGIPASAIVADVLVARKLEAPKSWRIVRIACGHDRSEEPERIGNRESVPAGPARWTSSKDLWSSPN